MDYSLIASILLITSSAQAESLACSPVGSLRCQLEHLERLGPRQIPINSAQETKAKIDPRLSGQFSSVYAITAERRAFLNLIRYLVLTWDEGNDSGYLAQSIAQAEAIGAYKIKTKEYEQALLNLWGSKGNKQYTSVAPRVQDQVALFLVAKSGALTQIDKAFASEEEMNDTLAVVANLFPIQASKDNQVKTTLAGVSAYPFYSTNIASLKLSGKLVTTVRFGDTVTNIAKRYGLTLQELLRLNPGLETARLVVGMQVRLAEASSERTRMELGLNPTTSSAQGWMWPTSGIFISGYGWREGKMHYGIDVANKVGTPIVAAKSGRVVFSGWHDSRYGYMVTISHADGSRSLYARNSRLMVRVGQDVEQGSLISLMGSSGHGADSFLHFEIHLQGSVAADPLQFLPGKAAALDPADLGFGLTKGQDQPAPSPAAFGDNPQPTTSMPPAPAPMPLVQPLRPDPAALPSRPPAPFDASLDELVRDGIVSPEERARIRSGSGMNSSVSAHQRACNSGALSQQECSSGLVVGWRDSTSISGPTVKPLSPNEQAVLQRIRSNSYTPQWRTYGQCKYDWAGWKLNSNGTRTTAAECGGSATRLTVGVICDRLLVATYTTASGWSKWRTPAGPGNKSRQGEDEMVAALCANV